MSAYNARYALIESAETFLQAAALPGKDGLVEGLPTLDLKKVSWENDDFNTAGHPLWASVYYRPNIPTMRTLGKGGKDNLTGILQIDLNVPIGIGEGAFLEWEKKLPLFFFGGRRFTHAAQSVLVIEAGITEGRKVENYFRKSITVSFRAIVPRLNT